jgi:hypothetical protein
MASSSPPIKKSMKLLSTLKMGEMFCFAITPGIFSTVFFVVIAGFKEGVQILPFKSVVRLGKESNIGKSFNLLIILHCLDFDSTVLLKHCPATDTFKKD